MRSTIIVLTIDTIVLVIENKSFYINPCVHDQHLPCIDCFHIFELKTHFMSFIADITLKTNLWPWTALQSQS